MRITIEIDERGAANPVVTTAPGPADLGEPLDAGPAPADLAPDGAAPSAGGPRVAAAAAGEPVSAGAAPDLDDDGAG